jgi:hypothetical protein
MPPVPKLVSSAPAGVKRATASAVKLPASLAAPAT